MLSVVVPVYNEKDNMRALLTRTVTALRTLSEPAEILIVDDDSPDGTSAEAEAVANELGASEMVRAIVRKTDRGLANAVMEGFRQARGDVLAVMDADLSHPPELLPRLLEPIRDGSAQLAVASRRCPGGGVSNWPVKRRIISWGAGLLARPLVPVKDTTSGFFAVKRSAIEGVELRPIGYKIGLEVFARAVYQRAVEVPFVFTDRVAGSSKLAGAVMLAYLVQLAGLYRGRFPRLVGFVQFGLVGSLGIVVDAAIFSLAYYYLGMIALGATAGSFFAQSVSFLGAAVFNFVLNRAWTFRERSSGARAGIFLLVSAGGYALRSPLIFALVSVGTPPIAALMAGIVVASVWNFLASRRWAFPEGGHARPVEDADQMRDETEMRARNYALILIFSLAALRLVAAGLAELTPDEAYFWQWSRHLDWGYQEQPPMVAYLIKAGTDRAGSTAFGVRLLSVVLSSATLFIVYRLGRRWAGTARAGLWAVAAFAAMPAFMHWLGHASPDVPLVFFWMASISHTLKSLRSRKIGDWILLGIVLGLGMLSKYPMLLMPPMLLVGVLVSRERRVFATPGPYIAAAVCAAICVPSVLWQMERGFEPVLFTLRRGLGAAVGADAGVPGSDAARAGLLHSHFAGATPLIVLLGAFALARGLAGMFRRRGEECMGRGMMRTDAALPVIVLPAVAALALFVALSFAGIGEAGGAAVVYASALALAGGDLARWSAGRSWSRRLAAWAVVGSAAAASLCAYASALERTPPDDRVAGCGGEELGRWASEITSMLPHGDTVHVLADDSRSASLLAFYMDGQPHTDVAFDEGRGSQYLAWRASRPVVRGDAALLVTTRASDDELRGLLTSPTLVGITPLPGAAGGTRICRAYAGPLARGLASPKAPPR